MKLHTIETGFFKLDGGAMHGVVPKTLWEKKNPADENNLCTWAMRCLLIDTGDKRILIDNGMGNKQDEKFFGYYYPHGAADLISSIRNAGYEPEDITDNWLTHLHFDHCGGGIKWNKDRTEFEPTFPNATYHTHRDHWDWAMNPNPREKASFLKENLLPMKEAGRLNFLSKGSDISPELDFILAHGHTEAMMLPVIKLGDKTILYMADLCPSLAHLRLAWVLSYDVRPLNTMSERKTVLDKACDENWVLFFEHDPKIECCTLKRTEKGVAYDELFSLTDIVD